jgi:hypothetical protein
LSLAFSQSKNDISATNIFGWKTAAPQFGLEFGFSGGAHFESGRHARRVVGARIRSQCYSALVHAGTSRRLRGIGKKSAALPWPKRQPAKERMYGLSPSRPLSKPGTDRRGSGGHNWESRSWCCRQRASRRSQ